MMLFRLQTIPILAFLISLWAGIAHASDSECPKTIAGIPNDALNMAATKVLQSLYVKLGCDVDFVKLPGRRGINHFNTGLIDGEVYRLRLAEAHYERPFIRSKQPLFVLANSLWVNPELKGNERHLIGYLLGVVWQENYMKTRGGRAFPDEIQMHDAYNKGTIKGFLASDFGTVARLKRNAFSPPPEREEVLLKAPLYHYLGEEFTPIMNRLERLLASDPFENIGNELGN